MPSKTRDQVKQDLQRAIGNIDNAKEKIGRWIDVYKEHHPDRAAAMHLAIQSLDMTRDFVSQIEESI
jgi:hypothetical protein